MDTNLITRFEVIDHSKDGKGRVFTKWNCQIELDVQDYGETLKVFVTDKPPTTGGQCE